MTDFGAAQTIQPQLNANQLDAFSTAISTEYSTWNIPGSKGCADLLRLGNPGGATLYSPRLLDRMFHVEHFAIGCIGASYTRRSSRNEAALFPTVIAAPNLLGHWSSKDLGTVPRGTYVSSSIASVALELEQAPGKKWAAGSSVPVDHAHAWGTKRFLRVLNHTDGKF